MAIYTAADIWINPVRAFGPAFISNQFGGHWVAWLGPVLGAVMGALCFQFIFSEKVRGERGGGGGATKRTQEENTNGVDLPVCNGGDVEGRPEKVPLHQQLQLVVEDKQRTAVASLTGAGRRSRVRPATNTAAAASNKGEATFFNYNAASDLDNLSLDGTKGRGREQKMLINSG